MMVGIANEVFGVTWNELDNPARSRANGLAN
jgi:hypothetical protein